ncbi:MAG: protoporphyrinogen oxidase [Planctomycetaceae bacterium]|nr:protoporphyrinogen oxidase [Planctomycetaceae bacterium]
MIKWTEKPIGDSREPRIAVIGGGISGLAAAHRIQELNPKASLCLVEAGSRLGGVANTERRDGYLIEHGPDNFITTMPWAIDLCKRIGFEHELVPTNDAHRRAFVVCKGKLRPIPSGFAIMAPSRIWPVLSTPILSPLGKLRLAAELIMPRRKCEADESMASFVARRLGRETYERLVQPLVGGIYTADPEQLSLDATMPRFRQLEKQHGSLIRGMWKRTNSGESEKKASGARYSQFMAPRDGMSAMIDAVANRLPKHAVNLNTPVKSLSQLPDGGWQITLEDKDKKCLISDGVVLALPSHQIARLLRNVDEELSSDLKSIQYGSCAIATFGFRREQIQHRLDGFGVVVPLIERRNILSASFSSVKYSGRAPDGEVLIRTFIGGACQRELLDLSDKQLLELARLELKELLGVEGRPRMVHINRQINAMPQYRVGHLTLMKNIADRMEKHSGLAIASNAMQGVGVPHCIHWAEVAAEKLLTKDNCGGPLVAP